MVVGIKKFTMEYIVPKITKNLTKKRKIQDEQIKNRDNIIEGLSDQSKINVKTKNPLYKFKEKISKIIDEKAKGGRVGLKRGTGLMSRKSNIQKIKETFAPKKRVNAKGGKLIGGQKNIDVAAPFGKITGEDFAKLRSKKTKKKVKGGAAKKKKKFPDLTGDGKVTFADVLKGRGVINGKKKPKKKII
jgi:hypothetical protein